MKTLAKIIVWSCRLFPILFLIWLFFGLIFYKVSTRDFYDRDLIALAGMMIGYLCVGLVYGLAKDELGKK